MPKKPKKRQNLPQQPVANSSTLDNPAPNGQQTISNVTFGHVAINSGPLPSVKDFAGYNHVLPGAAERIMAMAEKEQLHRHEGESKTIGLQRFSIEQQSRTICRAQWFALVCVMAILGVGALLVWTGNPMSGSLLSGGTIAGVVWAFLRSTGNKNGKNLLSMDKKQKST